MCLQTFIWPLARCASPEESLVVELRLQSSILLRTTLNAKASSVRGDAGTGGMGGDVGGASTSSSSRAIGSTKTVGRYVMLMQGCYVPKNIFQKYHIYYVLFVL